MAETVPVRIEFNPAGIDNPVLEFFLHYWNEKRGSRAMPGRNDISPRELKDYLGWVCLLDALPGYADFRYRLVGSRVSEYFLGDGTGRTVSEALADANKRILEGALWLFRKTCTDQVPIRVWSPGGEWKGRYYPDNDALYLPLSSDGKTADMVMNVFTFNYEEYKKTHSVRVLTHLA